LLPSLIIFDTTVIHRIKEWALSYKTHIRFINILWFKEKNACFAGAKNKAPYRKSG